MVALICVSRVLKLCFVNMRNVNRLCLQLNTLGKARGGKLPQHVSLPTQGYPAFGFPRQRRRNTALPKFLEDNFPFIQMLHAMWVGSSWNKKRVICPLLQYSPLPTQGGCFHLQPIRITKPKLHILIFYNSKNSLHSAVHFLVLF